jgi:hypothetical protein
MIDGYIMNKKGHQPAALDHIIYEMEMLFVSLCMVCRPEMDSNQRTAWMEVFAIHARNLDEFFRPGEESKGRMKSHKFHTWKVPYNKDTYILDRANSQIAHLNYNRETPEEKSGWDFKRVFEHLRNPCIEFLEGVMLDDDMMAYQNNRSRLEDILPRLRGLSIDD